MPAQSRRTTQQSSGDQAQAAGPAQQPSTAVEGTPEWANELQSGLGNSGVLAALKASLETESDSAAQSGAQDGSSAEQSGGGKATEQEGQFDFAEDGEGQDGATQEQKKPTGKVGTVHQKHSGIVGDMREKMTSAQKADLKLFKARWEKNKARYEAVSAKTNVPATLIAALHWRESTGNFGTYLHQGDKLGRAAVNVPKNIPIFHKWENAAVHALSMKDKAAVRDNLGMNSETTDAASMATYAEFYNGLGYHNRDRPSPYVYSGTDDYSSGKYVSDGKFSSTTKDRQLGVMTMVDSIGGMDEDVAAAGTVGPRGWDSVLKGRVLQRGMKGPLIKLLQEKLKNKGFDAGDDGDFGPIVEKNVKAFQSAQQMDPDGRVGKDTAQKLVEGDTDGIGP